MSQQVEEQQLQLTNKPDQLVFLFNDLSPSCSAVLPQLKDSLLASKVFEGYVLGGAFRCATGWATAPLQGGGTRHLVQLAQKRGTAPFPHFRSVMTWAADAWIVSMPEAANDAATALVDELLAAVRVVSDYRRVLGAGGGAVAFKPLRVVLALNPRSAAANELAESTVASLTALRQEHGVGVVSSILDTDAVEDDTATMWSQLDLAFVGNGDDEAVVGSSAGGGAAASAPAHQQAAHQDPSSTSSSSPLFANISVSPCESVPFPRKRVAIVAVLRDGVLRKNATTVAFRESSMSHCYTVLGAQAHLRAGDMTTTNTQQQQQQEQEDPQQQLIRVHKGQIIALQLRNAVGDEFCDTRVDPQVERKAKTQEFDPRPHFIYELGAGDHHNGDAQLLAPAVFLFGELRDERIITSLTRSRAESGGKFKSNSPIVNLCGVGITTGKIAVHELRDGEDGGGRSLRVVLVCTELQTHDPLLMPSALTAAAGEEGGTPPSSPFHLMLSSDCCSVEDASNQNNGRRQVRIMCCLNVQHTVRLGDLSHSVLNALEKKQSDAGAFCRLMKSLFQSNFLSAWRPFDWPSDDSAGQQPVAGGGATASEATAAADKRRSVGVKRLFNQALLLLLFSDSTQLFVSQAARLRRLVREGVLRPLAVEALANPAELGPCTTLLFRNVITLISAASSSSSSSPCPLFAQSGLHFLRHHFFQHCAEHPRVYKNQQAAAPVFEAQAPLSQLSSQLPGGMCELLRHFGAGFLVVAFGHCMLNRDSFRTAAIGSLLATPQMACYSTLPAHIKAVGETEALQVALCGKWLTSDLPPFAGSQVAASGAQWGALLENSNAYQGPRHPVIMTRTSLFARATSLAHGHSWSAAVQSLEANGLVSSSLLNPKNLGSVFQPTVVPLFQPLFQKCVALWGTYAKRFEAVVQNLRLTPREVIILYMIFAAAVEKQQQPEQEQQLCPSSILDLSDLEWLLISSYLA